MAKSRLKTLIQEIYGVERDRIEFCTEDLNTSDEGVLSIDADNCVLFSLEANENNWCCGIMDLGETRFNRTYNGFKPSDFTEELQNEFYVQCMNQVYKEYKKAVKAGETKRGLLTWTHTDDNSVVRALLSEFNTEDMPWKLKDTFFNPNSGNTVCLFTANLNVEKKD